MNTTTAPAARPRFEFDAGVDIAKNKFDAAIPLGEKWHHKAFPNDPAGFAAFLAWLSGLGVETSRCRICMEATGAYGVALAEYLSDRGVPVSVANPAKVKAFGKSELLRAKTDKVDAKLIARFAAEKRPPLWTPPPPKARDLLALLRRVEQLLEMRQMERNRLDTAPAAAAPSVQALLDAIEAELQSVREAIRRHIDDDPDWHRQRSNSHFGVRPLK